MYGEREEIANIKKENEESTFGERIIARIQHYNPWASSEKTPSEIAITSEANGVEG